MPVSIRDMFCPRAVMNLVLCQRTVVFVYITYTCSCVCVYSTIRKHSNRVLY